MSNDLDIKVNRHQKCGKITFCHINTWKPTVTPLNSRSASPEKAASLLVSYAFCCMGFIFLFQWIEITILFITMIYTIIAMDSETEWNQEKLFNSVWLSAFDFFYSPVYKLPFARSYQANLLSTGRSVIDPRGLSSWWPKKVTYRELFRATILPLRT